MDLKIMDKHRFCSCLLRKKGMKEFACTTCKQLSKCRRNDIFSLRFAVFAHAIKGRKTGQNTPNLSTLHGAIPDAARSVGQRRTRHLATPPVTSVDFTSQKVCKNTIKQPFLQGADANWEF